MKLSFKVDDIRSALKGTEADIAASVTAAMKAATDGMKTDLRADTVGAGLSVRLSNTWRGNTYPKNANSPDATAYVYSNAPKIISVFANGAVIIPKRGRFLAIPTEFAGKGFGGQHLTPASWEARTGVKLQFVAAKGRFWLSAILRLRTGAAAINPGRRYAKPGKRTKGADLYPVVIFNLVPRATLKKRLDLDRVAQAWSGRIPALLADNWRV